MKISSLSESKKCVSCGIEFHSCWVRGAVLLRCPTCADIKQNRPSVVVDRGIQFSQICEIELLPADWELFKATPKDAPCWKISIKGNIWGVNWEGRIDIFSHDSIPPQPGNVVLLESCVTIHQRSDMAEKPLEIREYLRLSQVGQFPDTGGQIPKLIWLTATKKQTIKGLGRQYSYSLVGSPIWEKRISGGYRSGRKITTGALALVDTEHPLWVREDFNH